MLRIILLLLCFSLFGADAEAALAAPEAAAPVEVAGITQKVHRPRYKRYGRRRRLRRAKRKARKELRKAPKRRGVITVDPPVRNQ
ncbi:hypothetical protein [Hymenobacter sp. CRA2]|uniref:hypothetical protein n=1 Tax=Hymenobacter sp. CRA2 TaxID=1955620 RepID=UPI00098EF7CD|nr:hypothetical protein [Hymenobacter sp. CRA2]OON71102.1 hypothetical protein B0919_03685 [Hymenobacter sp. CRA2]